MPRPPVMGGRRGANGEKPKNFKKTVRNFFSLIKPVGFLFALAFLCAFMGVLCVTTAPKLIGNIVTAVADGVASESFDWTLIKKMITILIIFYVSNSIFRFFQHFILVGASSKIVKELRSRLNNKLDHLPLRYFDSRTQGEIMSRLTNDLDTIDQSLQEGISQAVISLFTLLCIFVQMLTLNLVMTATVIVTIPLFLFVIVFTVKRTQKYFYANAKYLGEANGHVEELYAGHSIVKAFNHEKQSTEEFRAINDKLYTASWKSNFYSSVMHPITGFIGNFGYILVVVVGALMTAAGRLRIGDIQSFLQYEKRFNQPIQEVANISNVFQSTLAAVERVFEILDEEDEVDDGKLASDPADGKVKFEDVCFSYTPERKLIQNFNLDVKTGTKVAIVGPTGAGKTTLVNLLMRFYDVDSGSIKVDGIDIRQWPRDVLRDQFGMVLQDTWLFEGSIAANIAYGDGTGEIDIEKVKECARRACADHFIETLPGAYDFVINEEASNVSQGEKQLLTIARAFMSDPRMLILDEATSNVDTRTERLVQTAMENLMEGRTSFIIAHRLSTIRDADLILVIDNGNIVEQGKHQELLDKGGFYSKLYYSQFTSAMTEG